MIAWLAPGDPPDHFPAVERALLDPPGLLAAGGDLSCERLGRVYFGESMFSLERDASKVALARLVRQCLADGTEMIDCQLPSAHLRSLGSRALPRQEFLRRLERGLGPLEP